MTNISRLRILSCLLAAMATLLSVVMAMDHPVGGSNGGWNTVTNLQAWAASQTFTVGDSLIFKYPPQHDVLEVSKADYDSCDTSNPIQIYISSNTIVQLTSPGSHYFICGSPGHCSIGMKVEIDVFNAVAASPPPPSSSPPPPSSSPPPPPQSSSSPPPPPLSPSVPRSSSPPPPPPRSSPSPPPPRTVTSPSPPLTITSPSPSASPPPPVTSPSSHVHADGPHISAVPTPTPLPSFGPAISPFSPSNSPNSTPTSAANKDNSIVGYIIGVAFFMTTLLIL